jgi:hypothetical protein
MSRQVGKLSRHSGDKQSRRARLTRRCGGLAPLAAELQIVISRHQMCGRNRMIFTTARVPILGETVMRLRNPLVERKAGS